MPCNNPIIFKQVGVKANGKKDLVPAKLFEVRCPQYFDLVKVPCNQCIACRISKSAEWALRCVHEASLHEQNSFITLTYDSEHLPERGTLVKEHFKLFFKRLRKYVSPRKIRVYYCGEYGDKRGRPHYHAIVFGYDFPDKVLMADRCRSRSLPPIYHSDILYKIWGKGVVAIGNVTYQSAGYVARYCTKKQTGKKAIEAYTRIDSETGEVYTIAPEFAHSSNRRGIGAEWFAKYASDCFPSDFLVHEAKKCRVPRYYNKLFELDNPEQMEQIKSQRALKALKHEKDLTPDRLAVREECLRRKIHKLVRPLEVYDGNADVCDI